MAKQKVEAQGVEQEMVKVFSLRPGSIITTSGTLEYNQIMEMPKEEADALVAQFPQFLRTI